MCVCVDKLRRSEERSETRGDGARQVATGDDSNGGRIRDCGEGAGIDDVRKVSLRGAIFLTRFSSNFAHFNDYNAQNKNQ